VKLADAVSDFRRLFSVNVNVEELKAHDAHLENLGNWYVGNSGGIHTASFYETRPVKDFLLVVNSTTARVGVGETPIPLEEDHLSICKPDGRDHQVYRAARRLIRDYVLRSPITPPDHRGLQTSSESAPSLNSGPTLSQQGPYVQDFVGRENALSVFDDALNGLLRRSSGSQPASNAEDCRLLWIHGIGGMGKSWLIRHAAVRAMNTRASVVLIDWDHPEWRGSLSFPPSSPEQMFEVIATRTSQVYGRSALQGYWSAWEAVKRSALDHRNLQLDFSAALDLIAANGPDWNNSIEIQAWTATGDTHKVKSVFALFDVLRQDPIATRENAADRVSACKGLRDDPMRYRSTFEQWASRLLGDTVAPELIRPAQQLADTLRQCLADASRTRPLVLCLDTCELLFGELEDWLRRLVRPMVSGCDSIFVVIGSRLFPDLSGSRDTWTTDIPRNRFRNESLDDAVLLSVGDIDQLVRRRGGGLAAIEDLPEKIHRVSLGVPLAVRVVIETLEFRPESIHDLAEIDLYADAALKPLSELSQLVIATVSDRFLLHLQNQPGKERDFMDVIAIGLLVSPTLTVLKKFWGAENAAARMRELSKRYSLIASGDLHLTIRDYVRRAWRMNPPDSLQQIASRLMQAVDTMLAAAADDQTEALMIEKANLKSWLASESLWESLAESLISLRARDYDTGRLRDGVLMEIPVHTADDVTKKEVLVAFCEGWYLRGSRAGRFLRVFGDSLSPRERALTRVFAGLELGDFAYEKAFPLLESLEECSDLTPALLRRAAHLYFAAPTVQSAGGGTKEPLRRVYKWYSGLFSPPKLSPFLFGSALRELGELERAEQVYKEGIEADPSDDGVAHQLAHLYEHSGKAKEAEQYFALAAERDPRFVDNWTCWARFQESDCRPEQALETLNRGTAWVPSTPSVEVYRYRLLRRTGHIGTELQSALEKAKALARESDHGSELNTVAWQLLEHNEDLASAELFARRAVELEPDNVSILHTLASILLAERKWSEAAPYVRTILTTCDPQRQSLRRESLDQLIADSVRVGKSEILVLLNEPQWNEYHAAASVLLRAAQDVNELAAHGNQIGTPLADRLKALGFVKQSSPPLV
jgi:tetratricopeptide (TPR) repeat protein